MEALSYRNASWEVYPQLSKKQFRMFRDAGIDPILTQLLYNRGILTLANMQKFLKADYQQTQDPFTLIDMPRAVARIEQALAEDEHITIYGDYDADGVTSSALLFRALRSLKRPDTPLDFHIPHRLRDGCGLNIAAIDLLKARGTRLIITTDCASSDVEQIAYANTLGIDVIITDHHHPPAQIPPAYAMINPWRPECTYGERYLCGVGIAFKLTQALYRNARRSEEDELDLLDLVAIGTIADIAPLLGENHVLVRLGMQRLNNTRKPGLQALIRNAKQFPGRIQERDISFGLAPRLNAAGRMQEAALSFRLLATESTTEATTLAAELEHLNSKRQQETEQLVRATRLQADEQHDKTIILVHGNDWHEGIIGLVAGKLAEEINKPVLVLSDDPRTQMSRGSARGQKHFNLIAALRAFGTHLERYGGHTQAAGFTIKSELIQQLHSHLLDYNNISHHLPTASNKENELNPPTGLVIEQESPLVANPLVANPKMIDLAFTKIERFNESTYKLLQQLGPFGANNPEPIFKMEKLRLVNRWISGYNRQNLRLRLGTDQGQIIGIYTKGARINETLATTTHVNVIFQLAMNESDSHPDIWLKIIDLEAAKT